MAPTSTKPTPTSANYPKLVYDLLIAVLDTGEITLPFTTPSPCWKTRTQIYGLRKALVSENHPRKHELEGISVKHDREHNTLTVHNLESGSDGLSVISKALHGTHTNTPHHTLPSKPPDTSPPPSVPTTPENPLEALLKKRNLLPRTETN